MSKVEKKFGTNLELIRTDVVTDADADADADEFNSSRRKGQILFQKRKIGAKEFQSQGRTEQSQMKTIFFARKMTNWTILTILTNLRLSGLLRLGGLSGVDLFCGGTQN